MKDKEDQIRKKTEKRNVESGNAFYCVDCGDYTKNVNGYVDKKICKSCHYERSVLEREERMRNLLLGSEIVDVSGAEEENVSSMIVKDSSGKKYKLSAYCEAYHPESTGEEESYITVEEVKNEPKRKQNNEPIGQVPKLR